MGGGGRHHHNKATLKSRINSITQVMAQTDHCMAKAIGDWRTDLANDRETLPHQRASKSHHTRKGQVTSLEPKDNLSTSSAKVKSADERKPLTRRRAPNYPRQHARARARAQGIQHHTRTRARARARGHTRARTRTHHAPRARAMDRIRYRLMSWTTHWPTSTVNCSLSTMRTTRSKHCWWGPFRVLP